MQPILNQAPLSAARQVRYGLMATAAVALMFGVAAAFGTAPQTVIYSGQYSEEIESLGSPLAASLDSHSDLHAREVRIQRGDTVHGLLAAMNIHDEDLVQFLRQSREADAMFRQLIPGKTLTAQITAQGELHSLHFPLNGRKGETLAIQRTSSGLAAEIRDLPLDNGVVLQTATINHSLFGAADDAGIPDNVASQLADIFGGDIDFHRDLRKGDRFSVIYETASHMGRSVRNQRILAAEFVNDGKPYRAFWFQGKDGSGGYYTEDGHNVRKAFLRSPLEFSRITSGFSNARYHPVLKETRAHRGIDYGAPTGTRVKTTSDGVVEFAGIQGGYGKVVMVRHTGNRMTVYGHLSGFAQGMRKGQRVSQGDVIGYVGATGIATGPHLHYEFRVAGVHRNPLTIALPEGAPISAGQLAEFKALTRDFSGQIASISDMRLVMLD